MDVSEISPTRFGEARVTQELSSFRFVTMDETRTMTSSPLLTTIPADLKGVVATLNRIKEKVPNICSNYSHEYILLEAAGDSPYSTDSCAVPAVRVPSAHARGYCLFMQAVSHIHCPTPVAGTAEDKKHMARLADL